MFRDSRRIKFVLAIALVAVATLFCFERLQSEEKLPRSGTLSDGSVLTVDAISFGTNLTYREVPPKPWQLAIGKRLPGALAWRLGWLFNTTDWRAITMPDGMTALCIFGAREGRGKSDGFGVRVAVLDEHGNCLDWNEGGGGSPFATRGYYHEFGARSIPAFPRREKILVVRFLRETGDGKADVPVMQFHIHNPAPGSYPTWKPEPWPVTRRQGDLEVTLTDFATGLSKGRPTRAAVPNEQVVTRLGLDLRENGRSKCSWMVKSVEVSDATGNRWNSYLWDKKAVESQGDLKCAMTLPGNLWPGETAWKLKVELAPRSGPGKSRFVEFLANPRRL